MFRAVLRFYWGIAPQALKTLGGALVRVDSWAGILTKIYFAAIGTLSRPLAAKVSNLWDGLPWWVLAVLLAAWVIGLFVWSMAKANYEAFTKVERRASDAEAENKRLAAQLDDKTKRKAVKDLLGVAVEQGESLRGDTRKIGNDIRFNTKDDVERWVDKTHDFIEAAFDKGEARHFLASGEHVPKNPSAVEEIPLPDTYEYHLEPCLRRLQELIVRANESEINHDFDPQYWVDRFDPE